MNIRGLRRVFVSWGIFGHVTCLEQSRARENILWIIRIDINTLLQTQQVTKTFSTLKYDTSLTALHDLKCGVVSFSWRTQVRPVDSTYQLYGMHLFHSQVSQQVK